MAGVADACAARGAKALHRCVHALAMQLVSKARPKGGAHSKQQDDYERLLRQLPAPPAEPASRSGRSAGKGGGAKSAPLAAASLASEDDDDEEDEYYYSDVEDREDEEDEEDEEDYDVFGFDDAYGLDASDNSQAQRHAHSRDRFDAHTPFPRLCGGVFSGAGQLVCFFASAYTRDTYPAGARRAAYRAEMSQQLRAQAKPRTLARLGNYQSMVQLGLQGSGLFFAYPSRRRRASASAGAGGGGGGGDDDEMLGEDDDDNDSGGDDDDDAAPRYYFRPHAPAQAQAVAELGNVALICHVAAATAADAALARDFVLGADADADAEAVCRHNARVAARRGGRAALAHTWTLLACLLAPGGGLGSARLWATHAPVARWVRAAVAHYAALGDVQTAALLSCVLSQAAAHAPPAPPPMAAVVEAVRAAIVSSAEAGGSSSSRAPAAPEDCDPVDYAIDAALADALGGAVAGVDATLGRRGVGGALSADLRRMAVLQAVYPGVAICEVPPLLAGSDWAPGVRSPELLRELDSDEIRQSELMMMEREQQQPPSSATRGAPWLTCSWCHEYVHGRALICHACGHGGHQLHMLRWFRSARKQLTRIGLAPVNGSRFGASNSNSSSSSNLGLLARPTAGAGAGAAFSPELAPLLPAPLSGIIRQKPALAVMSPTHDPACDDAAANRALLLDMQTTTTTTLPPAAGHLSRRGSKANILSQPASSDSSVAGYSDDDDDDFGYGVQSMLLSSRADDDDDDMQQQQRQQQEWDSSDVDSDDHLHTHPRAAAE
ncbi:hypothetical protein GGF42_007906, partial [Coemansia sp. RSA 2424]